MSHSPKTSDTQTGVVCKMTGQCSLGSQCHKMPGQTKEHSRLKEVREAGQLNM